MKRAAIVGIFAGLVLATVLIVHFGLAEVGAALDAAGISGLLAITAIQLVAVAVMGVAWWIVAGGSSSGSGPLVYIWGRLVRDSGSEVLPLSQVGGYVLGARAIAAHGIGVASAAATTVVDITFELCAQIGFTALGLLLLLQLHPGDGLALPVLLGLGIAVAATAGFVATQRRGADMLDRLAQFLSRDWLSTAAAGAGAVQDQIREAYARTGSSTFCFLLHFAAWIGTATEAWLALKLMGVELGFGPVLVIESLLYAIRSVAFAVPNAIGVQEGAYVMLGAPFGLSPDVALALSLLKRGRDLLIGVPTLLILQLLEGRRFWLSQPAPAKLAAREPGEPGRGD